MKNYLIAQEENNSPVIFKEGAEREMRSELKSVRKLFSSFCNNVKFAVKSESEILRQPGVSFSQKLSYLTL